MIPWRELDEQERVAVVIAVCGIVLLCLWALFG